MATIYLVVQICLNGYCGNYAVESYTQKEAAQCLVDAKTVQGSWCEMDGLPDGE